MTSWSFPHLNLTRVQAGEHSVRLSLRLSRLVWPQLRVALFRTRASGLVSSRRRKPPLPCRQVGGLFGAFVSSTLAGGGSFGSFGFGGISSGSAPRAVSAAKAKPFCQARFARLRLGPSLGVTRGSRMLAETSGIRSGPPVSGATRSTWPPSRHASH